jgi:hypothetical protein|tara:strand:+ start:546 stop:743 length:198 start_codon:yes stop_codon:yes gene_type:complete
MLSAKVIKYLENNGKNESELDKFNVILQNDMKSPPEGKVKEGNDYIHTWNVDGVNAPTQEQIDAL